MFDLLLFDLGGVLVDFAGFEELRRLLPAGVDAAQVRDRWIHSEAVHQFERGDFDAREFGHRFLTEWQLAMPIDDFLHDFAEWNRGPCAGALELLEQLGRTERLACLSNANEIHAPLHRQRLGHLFERCYFSNELRVAKPDPAIFTKVIDDLALTPSRIAYFDDTPVNVTAAASAGLVAFPTDGLAALERRLRVLGLLDPGPSSG